MRPTKLVTASLAFLLLGGVSLGVTSCAAVSEKASELVDQAEKAVKDATGNSVDVDAGTGVVVPKDWPTEIPLLDATVFTSTSTGTGANQTWTVLFSVDDPSAAYAEASQKLINAGFTASINVQAAEGSYGTFDNGTWKVSLAAAPGIGSEKGTLAYIAKASSSQ